MRASYILAAALALPVGARAQTYLNQLSVAAPALTDVIPFTQGYVGKGTGVTRNMTVGGLLSTPGSTQYVPFSGGTLSGPLNLPQGGTLTNPTIAGTFSPTTTNLNGAVSGVVGAKFNGSDVTTALQATITAAEATPQGGIIQLPCGAGVISQTIVVNAQNVHLRGCGIGIDWTGTTTVQAGTELRWGGATGGTMVKFAPPSGATGPLYDSDAQGILLNGQNVAAVGWDLQSIRNGTWNIGFAHVTSDGAILDTANIGGSPAFQGNDMTIIGDVRDGGATGVLAQDSGTPGTANVSLNLFRRIIVLTNTGWGLQGIDTDNNQFDLVDIFSLQGSSSNGIDLQTPHSGGNDTFRYVNTNGGQIKVETGYAQAWFYMLDKGNSTPYPTLSGTATAYWQTNSVNRGVVPNMSYNCGTGAITADITDGTNANCRGANAVDLQTLRQGTGQVASGIGSGVLGYSNNEADGVGCWSVGYTWNFCDTSYGLTLGSFAVSTLMAGSMHHAAEQLSRGGDMQEGWLVLGVQSADTSPHRLLSGGSTPSIDNCFNIADHATYGFELTVIAQDVTTAGNRMVVRYPYAMIARDAGAGTTAVSVGTPSTLTQGTTGTIATPSADATNGCINLTWTAPNSDSWKVVARIHDVETGN